MSRLLPAQEGPLFLAYVGMETDLLFTQGVDLPGFASYPLLENVDGRALLRGYYRGLMELAAAHGMGAILESPTWVANRDRGAAIGTMPAQLAEANRAAIALLAELRAEAGGPVVISANVGPRDDAYAPGDQMEAATAEVYHAEQIETLAETEVDVISGYTLAYPAEAVGIVRAAQARGLPVVISFTVETDGRLPTGQTLGAAIAEVDAQTGSYARYFMINCAHPEHFEAALQDAPWMDRIQGIVANASRCSHAELDEAEVLDAGNPQELGQQLAALQRRFPQIRVLGGCCGTDMRHMTAIAEAVRRA